MGLPHGQEVVNRVSTKGQAQDELLRARGRHKSRERGQKYEQVEDPTLAREKTNCKRRRSCALLLDSPMYMVFLQREKHKGRR
jgi:hypothetical protein